MPGAGGAGLRGSSLAGKERGAFPARAEPAGGSRWLVPRRRARRRSWVQATRLTPRSMLRLIRTRFEAIPMNDLFGPRRLRMFDVKVLGETIYENRGAGVAEIVVVIPLYNYAHTITGTLESVVKQDPVALAVIVVDDSSTDDGGQQAVDFLERHPARFSQAQVVRHHCNQGLAMARNSGVVHSN